MTLSFRCGIILFALAASAHADDANTKAVKALVESVARLETAYQAVLTRQAPLKVLETELLSVKAPLATAASEEIGVGREVSKQIIAMGTVCEKTAVLAAKIHADEGARFQHVVADLAELTSISWRLRAALLPAVRLTAAERRELAQAVAAKFGTPEVPANDGSSAELISRAPFASAIGVINQAFGGTAKP